MLNGINPPVGGPLGKPLGGPPVGTPGGICPEGMTPPKIPRLFPPMSLCRADGSLACHLAHKLSSQAWCMKKMGSPGLEMGFNIYPQGTN
jgi:hypothetical protein